MLIIFDFGGILYSNVEDVVWVKELVYNRQRSRGNNKTNGQSDKLWKWYSRNWSHFP